MIFYSTKNTIVSWGYNSVPLSLHDMKGGATVTAITNVKDTKWVV